MTNKNKILNVISILTGITLSSAGSAMIYHYVSNFFMSINQADQSMIFWLIPFLFLGLMLLITGIYFVVIAVKSFSGNLLAMKLVSISLKVIAFFVLLTLGIIAWGNLIN